MRERAFPRTVWQCSFCGALLAEQAEGEERENDQGDNSVEHVALAGEDVCKKRDAGDGGGDKDQQPELDDAAATQELDIVKYAGQGAEVGRLATKHGIAGRLRAVTRQIDHSTG